jgi:uncharacterized protein (TIGR00255 family)
MTGYARSEGREGSLVWVWEAKSVNGRGLDLRIRVPSGFDAWDVAAREIAQKTLSRGNLQVSLNVSHHSETANVRINQAFLEQVLGLCETYKSQYPDVTSPSWDGLLSLKGVIEAQSDEEQDHHSPEFVAAMKASLEMVMEQLATMRQAEGARIGQVLSAQIDMVESLAARAEGLAALRPEAQKARLRDQVSALLDASPALSEDRLASEVALLAVKADVREELDRLAAHVAAARDLIKKGGVIGRKLDFLSQEFNREANTLCSKAQDVELTRLGVDLKVVIDQFREQVQNIE